MVRKTFSLIILGSAMLLGGCFSSRGFNKMYPAGKENPPQDLAVIIAGYPLRVDSFDGLKVKDFGVDCTVIEMLPGKHEIVSHMDTAKSTFIGNGTYYSSGKVKNTFEAKPGWLYVLHSSSTGGGYNFRTFINGGPHPFKTPAGHIITCDLEKGKVLVKKGAESKTYDLFTNDFCYSWDSRHLAFKTKNGECFVVRDGLEGEHFKRSGSRPCMWSWDSNHFAYFVFKGRDFWIIVDETHLGPYDASLLGTSHFFDLEGRLIHAVTRKGQWYLMRNEKVLLKGNADEVGAAHQAERNKLVEFMNKGK